MGSTDTPAHLYRHVSVSLCIWTHSLIQECCLSISSRQGKRASGSVFRIAFYSFRHGQRVFTPTICGFLSAEHTYPLPVLLFIQSRELQLHNQSSKWRKTSY